MQPSVQPLDTNQPPPFEGRNLYATNGLLRHAVERHGATWAHARLEDWGATLGAADTFALADRANRHAPELRTHDRYGTRVDEVDFDPAWHALMTLAMREGEHASPWSQPRPGAQVARAAAYLMHAAVENGTQCPLTMTYAAYPALRRHAAALPWIESTWLPRLLSPDYDARSTPVAGKTSALIGMGMTERQGGSDVRSNATRATRTDDGSYRLDGSKWFFSAPMCDAHLVLAQAASGLSCFFLPRFLPDGSRNAVRLQRLKDKLGNRSNASSEVEFAGATAWLLGEEGRGVAVIIEMVRHTRLDCVIGSAGLIHGVAAQAIHHARHRRAFGKRLVDQPLMQNVLADLVLEDAAATALSMRLAAAFEATESGPDATLARLATPALKYWVCKRAAPTAAEALEVLGGNGYVEECPLPRAYREAPLNSIWEGSANVMCLDVLRAAQREPAAVDALLGELALSRGANALLDARVRELGDALAARPGERDARRLSATIALTLAGSLLVRHADAAIADAYCASRLDAQPAGAFGMLAPACDVATILARASPH
ncbi:MAG: isovaleryl-CoA dehydrogenase [Betaproteobacteria bacterium]